MSTPIVQDSIFFVFPEEKRLEILTEVIKEDGSLGSRQVCKDWQRLIDDALKSRWHQLKTAIPQKIPFDFGLVAKGIEKSFIKEGEDPNSIKYITLFRALNKFFQSERAFIPSGELRTSPSHFSGLQQFLKTQHGLSLKLMWKWLTERDNPGAPYFNNVEDMRNWLNNPETEEVRSEITGLVFTDLGIRFIPREICCFPHLGVLQLSKNHIDFLPSFLGSLKKVALLNLEDNLLEELPDDFPTWTHIRTLVLRGNPLSARAQALEKERRSNQALQDSAREKNQALQDSMQIDE